MNCLVLFLLVLQSASVIQNEISNQKQERVELLQNSKRILFLGDSITYSGTYCAMFETWMNLQSWNTNPYVINCGLPSETISGLSEKGHAGGKFPRPCLLERLDRVLDATKPDLVFACYGINCGIYQPLDSKRFQKYKDGFAELKQKVLSCGAKLIFVTPFSYDDLRAKKSFSYNEVMAAYSQWLLTQVDESVQVIDLHSALTKELEKRRIDDPKFTYQPDAVHPNQDGHWVAAKQLIKWFGDSKLDQHDSMQKYLQSRMLDPNLYTHIAKRMQLRRNSYLSVAGHQRPGIPKGISLEQLQEKDSEYSDLIQQSRKKNFP